MGKCFKRILSLFAVFAMVISLCAIPAYAEYQSSTSSYWSRIVRALTDTAGNVPLINTILPQIVSDASAPVCGESSDQLHHADSYLKSGEDSSGNPYVVCLCKHCGQEFKAYASDLDTAYKKYVQTLPASGYTSDGGLIWYPTVSDCTSFEYYYSDGYTSKQTFEEFPYTYYVSSSDSVFTASNSRSINLRRLPSSSKTSFSLRRIGFIFNIRAPLTGSYSQETSFFSSYSALALSGERLSESKDYSKEVFLHYSVGDSFFCGSSSIYRFSDVSVTVLNARFDLPVYKIIPDTAITPSPGEDYSAETRPGSLVGLYGDVNGSAFSDNEITLVDETGKTIYNPVTGETYNFKDWTYDYSTRTYTITTDNSQTVTVNYGDEYVTIKEGDTIYNVYYIVQGGGGTPVDPDACQHTYTSTTDREPTCTVPGSKTLTCSKCGNVTTESIPAKGHTWTILQTVQTSYDENGELVQQGYTIYQCSVCGEQYKDINGTGPPDGGGEDGKKSIWEKLGDLIGSVAGGFITIIETALGKVLDYLVALVEAINAKLESVVNSIFGLFDRIPQLFSGFTGFLVAVFPFMPQEFFDIIIFTLLVICVAAIIKFLWKK